jgi:signal transduction histidine kinase
LSYEKSAILSIQALVNQEAIASNPYSITQGLENLESIGLIRCSKLSHQKSGIVYIDTSFKGSCNTSFFQLNGRFLSSKVKAINGDTWIIDVVSNNSSEFQIMLWLVRFLTASLAVSFFKLHKWRLNSLLNQKNLEIENQNLKIESATHIAQIASQVSHDIRSPLAALQMVLKQIDNVPEEYRLLISSSVQRINDIANNLLNTSKNHRAEYEKDSLPFQLQSELIAPLIDSIVSEKRMQYLDKLKIKIELELDHSYGLFAEVNSIEFKSLISNLINNSVDAFESKGIVVIKVVQAEEDKILITIKDNGKGIPKHILTKLGEKGLTYGKTNSESGSGLGVYHAKQTIESFGGFFDIESSLGHGTTIKIFLPITKAPIWFLEKLHLTQDENILILDDDVVIHQIWSKHFNGKSLETQNFTNGNEFSKYVKLHGNKNLCLVDYELQGQNHTGLDLIESLQIANHAILVTSHYEKKVECGRKVSSRMP